MTQLMLDRRHLDGTAALPLMLGEVIEAARTAPRMRWECPMNRIVILAVGATLAAAVALAAGPLALAPIAVAALGAGLWWVRQTRPITAGRSPRGGIAWCALGIAGIVIGTLIPTLDGGELNEAWWTAMAVSLLAGTGALVAGIIFVVSDRATQPGAAPTA
ncbi:MAG: hypothetical protein M3Y51_08260 [Actinomycetota bacterium]|nr:hypothetical protein [Actinomycetota bacterium]